MASILIASLDLDEAELFAFALRFAGHQVTVTGEGEKFIHLASDDMIDLIIVDASWLASLDAQSWHSFNKTQESAGISTIVLIEPGQEHFREGWQGSSPSVTITKPISLDNLTKRVNRFLKQIGK